MVNDEDEAPHSIADGYNENNGYQIPNEEDYYQQEPTYRKERSASISSQKKSKPMPKENSLFIFKHTNR